MINQNESDRPSRKSARATKPNAFYTQAITELKRAPPKTTREQPVKSQSKKQRIYQQSEPYSQVQQQLEEAQSAAREETKNWYACRMPKTGQMLRVQFLMNRTEVPIVEKKKEQPPKITKKTQSSFDLLSLFQKAIVDVNEEIVDKPAEIEPIQKQVSIKHQRPLKQTKKPDAEGSITAVRSERGKVVFVQSVIGQVQVSFEENELTEEIDQAYVDQLKEKVLTTQVLPYLPVFQAQD